MVELLHMPLKALEVAGVEMSASLLQEILESTSTSTSDKPGEQKATLTPTPMSVEGHFAIG